MDEDAGPQYLFVVVSHKDNKDPGYFSGFNPGYFSSILQLETPQLNNPQHAPNLPPTQIKPKQVYEKEYVARFSQPHVGQWPIKWLFSPSSEEDLLYMLPDCNLANFYLHVGAPLHGFKLNMRNLKIEPINPPTESKLWGHVVNREGRIYFIMAHPDSYYESPDPVFECYDPGENKWKAIPPFPDHSVRPYRHSIAATAVWDDTILYFMASCWEIWAYNVGKNKWYNVNVVGDECYKIVGEGVVLGNTIYALTDPEVSHDADAVLALSIEREEINGDHVYTCSLLSTILVPGMDQIKFEDANAYLNTRHLVYLGKDNFCLVQSCNRSGLYRYQPIQLTSIKLDTGKRSMTVTGLCIYEVDIFHGDEHFQDRYKDEFGQHFEVRLCFSLPECRTIALNQGEEHLFNLNPFPEDYASDKTEDNCIRVRNIPPDATFEDLKSAMECLGSIKRAGMRVVMNNTGHPFAIVEFEAKHSIEHAIERSAVIIGDGLSIVDCHRTSGINKHCEAFQSKTICGGRNVKGGVGYKLRSCSKSSHMDDAGPLSLFVVVSWDEMAPGSISLVQLDNPETNHEYASRLLKKRRKKLNRGSPVKPQPSFSDLETELSQEEYVAHLSRPQGSAVEQWALTSCSDKLYMLPYWDISVRNSVRKIYTAMHGCIFDVKAKTIQRIQPPKANKYGGHAVSLDGFIYFLAQPSLGLSNPDPAFERYDPANDAWETLEPFPLDGSTPAYCAVIEATIVWKNTILYSMQGEAIWAYDVLFNKWYHVVVEDPWCYRIHGEAVVVENTIYALAVMPFDVVLALSVERKGIGDDPIFKCSVRSRIRVPGMQGFSFDNMSVDDFAKLVITRHLVRFGKDNFCLVQSCNFKDGLTYSCLPIHVTKIKFQEEKLTMIDRCIHWLRVPGNHYFKVGHCFSLPERLSKKNTGERLFYFDPYPSDSEKGYFSDCEIIHSHVYATPPASERSNTDEEGHLIYLRNLPSDATFRQIEMELKKFGVIKEKGIRAAIDDKGCWSAIAEFESETSRQSAIKASRIIIKGCSVEIEDYYPAPDSADGCKSGILIEDEWKVLLSKRLKLRAELQKKRATLHQSGVTKD